MIGLAEALSAPEVAWSITDTNTPVVAIARRGRRSALRHSDCVTVHDITPPEASLEAALHDLHEAVEEISSRAESAVTLLPLDDAAVWLFSNLPKSPNVRNAGPPGASLSVALDKRVQVAVAQASGLNVPRTTVANTSQQVLERSSDLPLVMRPADALITSGGVAQKGRNWICASITELNTALRAWGEKYPLLIQPFLSGNGEGVFGLATADGVQAWSAHRRLRMMNPHGSGSSACVSQPVPEELKLRIADFIHRANWLGLFMVEILHDIAGTRWFIEFNGRPWGSMALSRRQGFEYPAWAIAHANGRSSTFHAPDAGGRTLLCRNLGRELLHLFFVLRGPQTSAIRNWPSFWKTAYEVIRPWQKSSLYNWQRNDSKVFWADFWYTVTATFAKSRH